MLECRVIPMVYCDVFATMATVQIEKNLMKKRPRLTHGMLKRVTKMNRACDTNAVIQILFKMGYTSYNITQRLNEIEVLLRLLPPIPEEERQDGL